MNKLNFGKNIPSAIIAMVALILIGLGCSAEKPAAPPTEAEAQALVKATMSEFADAVDKGDFAAFKANTSKEFQSQYTDEQMKTTFKVFTDQKADVVPILRDAAKKNIAFSPAQTVREEKGYSILVAGGTIDSDPQTVKVNNEYVYQDGKWKLLKVGVVLQ
jgi:hypothetical protein